MNTGRPFGRTPTIDHGAVRAYHKDIQDQILDTRNKIADLEIHLEDLKLLGRRSEIGRIFNASENSISRIVNRST